MAGAYNMGSAQLKNFKKVKMDGEKVKNRIFVRGIHGITLHLINDISNFCVSLHAHIKILLSCR
jgi:hypothetical protein